MVLYEASAGSGKTFQLTCTVLALALRTGSAGGRFDPGGLQRVLAVTFTRKATREIRERVLDTLVLLANPPLPEHSNYGTYTGYAEEIRRQLAPHPPDPATLAYRARILYHHLVYYPHQAKIYTIDSFFQNVLRAFARELNLPNELALSTDNDRILDLAVRHLLDRVGRPGQEALTHHVVEMALQKLEDNKSWQPERIFDTLRQKLTDDFITQAIPDLKQTLGQRIVAEVFAAIREHRQAFLTDVRRLKARVQQCLDRHGLTVDAYPYKASGFLGVLNLGSNAPPKFSFGKRTREFIDDPYKTLKSLEKTNPLAYRVGLEELHPLFVELAGLITGPRMVHYHTVDLIADQSAVFEVFHELYASFEAVQAESAEFLVSTVAAQVHRLLYAEGLGGEVPFIYEKLAERLEHILMDEFQDTSGIQWENFLPLVVNSLAQGQACVLVGDAKQAIYSFRGGDVSLILHGAPARLKANGFDTDRRSLATNWRSDYQIVAFNNALYALLRHHPALLEPVSGTEAPEPNRQPIAEALAEHRELLQNAYASAEQHLPEAKLADPTGYVCLELNLTPDPATPGDPVEPDTDTDTADAGDEDTETATPVGPYIRRIREIITECRAQGYDWSDIAILTNKNDELVAVAAELQALGWPVQLDRQQGLLASPVVQLLQAVLRYANAPGDHRSRVEFLKLYRYDLELCPPTVADLPADDWLRAQPEAPEPTTPPADTVPPGGTRPSEAWAAGLPPDFVRFFGQVCRLPVYEQLEELVRLLELHRSPRVSAAHVAMLVEVARDVQHRQGPGVQNFLDYLAEHADELQVPVGQSNALRLLSIHKSKGLEFPVVILPYFTFPFVNKRASDEIIWPAVDAAAPDSLRGFPFYPIKAKKDCLQSYFARPYLNHYLNLVRESLNKVYVATTRACHRLYILAAQPTDGKGIPKVPGADTIQGVLIDALGKAANLEGLRREGYPYADLAAAWNDQLKRLELGTPTPKPRKASEDGASAGPSALAWTSSRWQDKLMVRPLTTAVTEATAAEPVLLPALREALSRWPLGESTAAWLDRLATRSGLARSLVQQLTPVLEAWARRPELQPFYAPAPTHHLTLDRVVVRQSGHSQVLDRVVETPDGTRALIIRLRAPRPATPPPPDAPPRTEALRTANQSQARSLGRALGQPIRLTTVYLLENEIYEA